MDIKTVNLSENPGIKKLIQCAFPKYSKRKAMLSYFPENGINVNTYWDGGSRDEYAIVHIPSMQKKLLPSSTHPYYDLHGNSGSTADVLIEKGNVTLKRLPPDFVLIRTGTFCGKPATAHVYLPNKSQNVLEAENVAQ